MTLYLAVTMAMAACGHNAAQEPFKYRVEGKTNYIPDKAQVILAHGIYSGQKPTGDQIISTMTVQKGTFSFEGNAKATEACILYFPSEGAFMPVIIEKGTIQVFFDKDPNKTFVHGTPLNDSLQMLAKKNLQCAARFQQQLNDVHEPPSPEDIDKMQEYRTRLLSEIGTIHYGCAMRNIDNELGFFLTVTSYEFFTKQQLQTLLKKLPRHRHNHPVIKMLETPPDKVIPSFSLSDKNGFSYNVKTLAKQSKITIIDFWASWCGPCMNEMPNLVALYNKYKNSGLGIIGISLDNDKTAWVNAFERNQATWIQLWDKEGMAADLFQVKAIPHTVIVNRDGEVLATKLRGKDLEIFITNCLQKNN